MMIEPTLANPRSEIIEFLMGTLGADPERVITLARHLTESFEEPPTALKPLAKKVAKPEVKAAAKKAGVARKTAPAKKLAKAVRKPSGR
jgi:hypothetical protein